MTNKSFLVGAVVIAIIATFLGVSYPKVNIPVNVNPDDVPAKLGSVDVNNYNNINFQGGIRGTTSGFNSTTTIACMIQNPTNATTTFANVGIRTRVSTTTTTVLAVSTSTNASRFSTSTSLMSKTVSANSLASATFVPTSNNNILGPSEWVLVGYGAGTTLPSVAQAQNGECSVLFTGI